MLPRGTEAAAEAMRACDLCLVVGTSAVVQPAASLVDLAPGTIRVVINPERTEHAIGAGYLLQAGGNGVACSWTRHSPIRLRRKPQPAVPNGSPWLRPLEKRIREAGVHTEVAVGGHSA